MKVFIAHSFHANDYVVFSAVERTVKKYGLDVLCGTDNNLGYLADEIKKNIEASDFFIALCTCRFYVKRENIWTISPWIIEEKGYFLGSTKNKKMILLVENGISVPSQIGGLHGDLEHFFFDRFRLDQMQFKLESVLSKLVFDRK